MNVLDLFSGIGAFSLGLERAGMRTVAFCECDSYCRRVLAKRWPEIPCYDDVRSLTADRLRADGISVDVICGGFPCQDISVAGRGAGIGGERSGLWSEFARLIGELRPRYALVENVAALLFRGLGDVLGDMAALGYDAEWHCIPAAAVGAPHIRDRVWIIAQPQHSDGDEPGPHRAGMHERAVAAELRDQQERVAGSFRDDVSYPACEQVGVAGQPRLDGSLADVADATSSGCGEGWSWRPPGVDQGIREQALADADSTRLPDGRSARQSAGTHEADWRMALAESQRRSSAWWLVEPDVGRVAHGVASRVDRLKGLGNSLVPQIPEMIGRAIMAHA